MKRLSVFVMVCVIGFNSVGVYAQDYNESESKEIVYSEQNTMIRSWDVTCSKR